MTHNYVPPETMLSEVNPNTIEDLFCTPTANDKLAVQTGSLARS